MVQSLLLHSHFTPNVSDTLLYTFCYFKKWPPLYVTTSLLNKFGIPSGNIKNPKNLRNIQHKEVNKNKVALVYHYK